MVGTALNQLTALTIILTCDTINNQGYGSYLNVFKNGLVEH
jgi:hypothetical protein